MDAGQASPDGVEAIPEMEVGRLSMTETKGYLRPALFDELQGQHGPIVLDREIVIELMKPEPPPALDVEEERLHARRRQDDVPDRA